MFGMTAYVLSSIHSTIKMSARLNIIFDQPHNNDVRYNQWRSQGHIFGGGQNNEQSDEGLRSGKIAWGHTLQNAGKRFCLEEDPKMRNGKVLVFEYLVRKLSTNILEDLYVATFRGLQSLVL